MRGRSVKRPSSFPLFVALIALVLAVYGLATRSRDHGNAPVAIQETAFDRVMRTGILRCGYYVFPPVVIRDSATNQMSGLTIDMMNTIAAASGLKIEWTEEITFGNWTQELASGRIDAVCTPSWPDIALGREVLFTHPILYSGIVPLVRADDMRFDQETNKLNDPSVTISGQEGDLTLDLAKELYPKAHLLVLPATSDGSIATLNVAMHKADAILLDVNAMIEFNRHNDSKLKMLDPAHPLKAQAFVLAVKKNEFALREFLDNAVADLLASGNIDRLLTKWETVPGEFFRMAPPYQIPSNLPSATSSK